MKDEEGEQRRPEENKSKADHIEFGFVVGSICYNVVSGRVAVLLGHGCDDLFIEL